MNNARSTGNANKPTASNKTVAATGTKARVPVRQAFSAPPRQDLKACKICGRKFNLDRIDVHEDICRRTAHHKRKVFDPRTQRVVGTEAEPFVRKLLLQGPARKQVILSEYGVILGQRIHDRDGKPMTGTTVL